MPLPSNLTTITVTGTYQDPSGNPPDPWSSDTLGGEDGTA